MRVIFAEHRLKRVLYYISTVVRGRAGLGGLQPTILDK